MRWWHCLTTFSNSLGAGRECRFVLQTNSIPPCIKWIGDGSEGCGFGIGISICNVTDLRLRSDLIRSLLLVFDLIWFECLFCWFSVFFFFFVSLFLLHSEWLLSRFLLIWLRVFERFLLVFLFFLDWMVMIRFLLIVFFLIWFDSMACFEFLSIFVSSSMMYIWMVADQIFVDSVWFDFICLLILNFFSILIYAIEWILVDFVWFELIWLLIWHFCFCFPLSSPAAVEWLQIRSWFEIPMFFFYLSAALEWLLIRSLLILFGLNWFVCLYDISPFVFPFFCSCSGMVTVE